MNFELVKDEILSGSESSIYQVYLEREGISLFDRFVEENIDTFPDEIDFILDRLEAIGNYFGARKGYFKDREGVPGDFVHCLYDEPDFKLRLFCIRINMDLIILGGGGRKEVRAWQDDPKLKYEGELIKWIAAQFFERYEEGDIKYINEGKDLFGNLKFKFDER